MNKRDLKKIISFSKEGVADETIFNLMIDLHKDKPNAKLAESCTKFTDLKYRVEIAKLNHRIEELLAILASHKLDIDLRDMKELLNEHRHEGSDRGMESGEGEDQSETSQSPDEEEESSGHLEEM